MASNPPTSIQSEGFTGYSVLIRDLDDVMSTSQIGFTRSNLGTQSRNPVIPGYNVETTLLHNRLLYPTSSLVSRFYGVAAPRSLCRIDIAAWPRFLGERDALATIAHGYYISFTDVES